MKTLILYLLVFLSIINHQTIILENQKILSFFLYQLLPSLFILCILIQLLPFPKTKSYKLQLLNINTNTLYLIIKMILLGIPTSAYLINQLVKEKQINETQGKRLIHCICIPSISFMLMTIPFLKNLKFALILFTIHCISSFILLFITRNNEIFIELNIKNNTLSNALLFTIKSMAFILSYLFIIVSLKSLFIYYIPSLNNIIHLFFEFSSGISTYINHSYSLFYCLICIGFSGLCAHLQIMNGCDFINLDYKVFLFYRIIHCLCNLLLFGCFQFITQILHFF